MDPETDYSKADESAMRDDAWRWLEANAPDMLSFDAEVNKAGLVPFRRMAAGTEVHLLKPVARHPGLTAPAFQICKGTRCIREDGGGWRDAGEKEFAHPGMEPCAVTALREAQEELGLRLGQILSLHWTGVHEFRSEKTGRVKRMALFCAEVKREGSFGRPHPQLSKTLEQAWFEVGGMANVRSDHKAILERLPIFGASYHS